MSETFEVVATGAAAEAVAAHVPGLVDDGFAGKLFAQDATLWGPDAEEESAKRLSWVGLAESSRPLVEPVSELRTELDGAGIDHVVLCGMGGSSLAPEVVTDRQTRLPAANHDRVEPLARIPLGHVHLTPKDSHRAAPSHRLKCVSRASAECG